MIPEDAQLFSLVVSVDCFEWDLEVCDEKTHGVEIIAAMAVSWENKRLSQNLAFFFPKTSHVQRNLGCCSRCFPLLSKKDVCTFSYYLPESKKIHFSDFLGIERTHLGLQNPISGVLLVERFTADRITIEKTHSHPIKKHSPVAFAGPWMFSGRFHYLGLRYMASQHALHLQVLAGCMCWNLIHQPENMKHASWSLILVCFWLLLLVV